MHGVILHGAFGTPEENWFPWLKNELLEQGWHVDAPTLPTPEGQSLEAWLKVLRGISLTPETTIFAHSIAPAAVAHWLTEQNTTVQVVHCVSPFWGKIGNETFDTLNASFFAIEPDWNAVQNRATVVHHWWSEDDPYVQKSVFLAFVERWPGVLHMRTKAGHFNAGAGYAQFPELLGRLYRRNAL